jgi:5-methylcytosine-specific restriction endonuclease McrA
LLFWDYAASLRTSQEVPKKRGKQNRLKKQMRSTFTVGKIINSSRISPHITRLINIRKPLHLCQICGIKNVLLYTNKAMNAFTQTTFSHQISNTL